MCLTGIQRHRICPTEKKQSIKNKTKPELKENMHTNRGPSNHQGHTYLSWPNRAPPQTKIQILRRKYFQPRILLSTKCLRLKECMNSRVEEKYCSWILNDKLSEEVLQQKWGRKSGKRKMDKKVVAAGNAGEEMEADRKDSGATPYSPAHLWTLFHA